MNSLFYNKLQIRGQLVDSETPFEGLIFVVLFGEFGHPGLWKARAYELVDNSSHFLCARPDRYYEQPISATTAEIITKYVDVTGKYSRGYEELLSSSKSAEVLYKRIIAMREERVQMFV